jgi:small acid-soluble spore protein H (minor)
MIIKKIGDIAMDINRAKEIFNSLGVIEVCYKGCPVWIEKIDEDRAQVQDIETNQSFEVSVNDLVEGPMFVQPNQLISRHFTYSNLKDLHLH